MKERDVKKGSLDLGKELSKSEQKKILGGTTIYCSNGSGPFNLGGTCAYYAPGTGGYCAGTGRGVISSCYD